MLNGYTTPYVANLMAYQTFTRPQEKSWQLRYDYDFAGLGLPGLNLMTRYVQGRDIDRGAGRADDSEWERNTDLSYVIQSGPLKSVALKWRNITYRSRYGADLDENRFIVNYTLKLSEARPLGAAGTSILESQVQMLLLPRLRRSPSTSPASGASGSLTGVPSRRSCRRRRGGGPRCGRAGSRVPAAGRSATVPAPGARDSFITGRPLSRVPSANTARGIGGGSRGVLAVRQGGGGIGQDHLRFVQLGALQGAQAAHLIHRQFAEQGEEATDVAIIAVAPELPEVERRQALGVEPYRTLRRLCPSCARHCVASSGMVRPNSWAPPWRRDSSTPLMMFAHWSAPPSCRVQPRRRDSSTKS